MSSREIVALLTAAGLRRRRRSRLAPPPAGKPMGALLTVRRAGTRLMRRKEPAVTSCAHLDATPMTPFPGRLRGRLQRLRRGRRALGASAALPDL